MIAASRPTLIGLSLLALAACGDMTVSKQAGIATADPTGRTALLVASCSGCHMPGGTAIKPLDTLSANSITEFLQRYRSETEGTTVMHRLARGFSDDDVTAIAAHLGHGGGP